MVSMVTCISMNVEGLNNIVKRRRVAKLLMAKQAAIICLQETHLRTCEEHYLHQVFRGEIHYAAALTKTKGVLLGFSKRLPWRYINDLNGRFLIVNGFVGRRELIIV